MAQYDIDNVLDHLRRIKNGGHLVRYEIDRIETLEMDLRFLRTFLKYHLAILPDFLVKITKKAKLIVKMLQSVFGGIPDECKTNLNVEKLASHLLEFIQDNTSSRFNYELDYSYLSDYMSYLDTNLNDALRYLVNSHPILIEQVKILRKKKKSLKQLIFVQKKIIRKKIRFQQKGMYLDELEIIQKKLRILKQLIFVQKKMRLLRYLYVTEIKGYVDHEKLKGLQMRIQFMAENVGNFCLVLWVVNKDYADSYSEEDEDDAYSYSEEDADSYSNEDEDDAFLDPDGIEVDTFNIQAGLSKPTYLLFLVVLVELEMKKIFHCELKASKFTQSRIFKDKKLPKGFSHHLHSLLVYFKNKQLENFLDNVSAQNIDVAIEFLLVFLDADLSTHVINGNWLNDVMEKVLAIACDVLYVIQKLLPRSINKDDTSKINICSIQILGKTKDLNAQVETYYKSLKFTPSQFPMVGGLSFLDSLLRKLNEMSKSESGLVFMMKPDIGNLVKELSSLTSILEKELSSLSSIFRDVAKVHHEHENLKDHQSRTINLAYEAEVAIDSILAHYNVFWHIFCSLPTILKEIKHINAEVTKTWSAEVTMKPCYVVAPSKHLPTQHSNSVNDEEIVGFEIAADKLIQYLTRGVSELDVIPIVGMGGQGKTTCARKLYNNDIIVSHFDVRAWCIISQTYNRRDLLQEIFSQVTGSKDNGDKDDVLADMLRKSLIGKRYLIVLDDMWDGVAWDDLRFSFPDVGNRSRVVITTRLEKVGEHVKHHTDPYSLPFLTPDESLKLLKKKVFQQESLPPELKNASLAIVKKCKGLPLVIILVAGIIKRKKMEASWWDKIKYALISSLGESEGYSLSTMQLSYDNLPDYLRPCLLYMGMFPEDARIPVSKLTSLWIAEGFVQNIESGRSMEEAAEDYLMDLISSNVVMVSMRRYNGKVKYCQVHDVVLHFCLEKSREEKFMLAVKGDFQPLRWKESRVSLSFGKELSKFASLGSKTRKPFHQQHLRSLITTKQRAYSKLIPIHLVSKLRLVKVLDLNLSYHIIDVFSSATLKPLIHLKYLAVEATEFYFHPESHLPHLETLILMCLLSPRIPAIFWKMEKLRHVEIKKGIFELEKDKQGIFEESSKLENLRILRSVNIRNADNVDVLLRRCPNLQQLDISLDEDIDSVEICPKLESLTQLQILRFSSDSHQILHLPSNLKKLVLRGPLIDSTISFIAELPSLEYLQLTDSLRSLPEKWCLGDITFHKLKFLKLVTLNISRWDVSQESFPQLETLVIKWCDKLEEIPLSFADIPTLKQIKLIDCENKPLHASAVKIKEDVEENEGNDRIDLINEPHQFSLFENWSTYKVVGPGVHVYKP
ncbi:hypothetical protein RND71_022389 [Anisodus tanguticus]|uniref:NB-ARC domain-containing protein n=1 Tax=Anisodus tanguticus TaxID=243964 RepID=A0AAE1RT76_9SOLA|nr:hypothetical protein RND71_022389 [Anisodus tanguticus]